MADLHIAPALARLLGDYICSEEGRDRVRSAAFANR
jgi:hypothetical protein